MDWIKKNYDLYSKLIAGAIHGKPIGCLVAGNVKTSAKNQKMYQCQQVIHLIRIMCLIKRDW